MKNMKKRWNIWKQRAIRTFDLKGVLLILGSGELALGLINLLCFMDPVWMLPLQPLLIPWFSVMHRRKQERRRDLCEKGFRELLQSLMASLQAGYSLENACLAAVTELEETGRGRKPDAFLVQMRNLEKGIRLHVDISRLFAIMAEETGVEEIRELAAVIEIAARTGGNIVEIMRCALEHMRTRMETTEEIRVAMSGKLFEKNIMLLMPFLILFYLRLTNPEYVRVFYESMAGHVIMAVILLTSVGCYFWSEKIMAIEF